MTASRSSTSPPDRGEATADPDKDGTLARAKALATAGDFDQAIALYRTLLAGEPENAGAAARARPRAAAGRSRRRGDRLLPARARARPRRCARARRARPDPERARRAARGRRAPARGRRARPAPRRRARRARRASVSRRPRARGGRRASRRPGARSDQLGRPLSPGGRAGAPRPGAARRGDGLLPARRSRGVPGHAAAHLQLGLAFWNRGDPAPAIALAERAVRLDPKLPAAHGVLGAMLRTVGRSDEAIADPARGRRRQCRRRDGLLPSRRLPVRGAVGQRRRGGDLSAARRRARAAATCRRTSSSAGCWSRWGAATRRSPPIAPRSRCIRTTRRCRSAPRSPSCR